MKYVLSVIGMILLGFIAVILFARNATNTNQTAQIGKQQVHTTDYINSESRVEFIQNGSIVSNEKRRTLKISVTQSERVAEVLEGYNESVIKRQTFGNNADSYYVFMNALDHAGFTRQKKTDISNPVGYCASGLTYYYILHNGDEEPSSLWNSSCAPLAGNLGNSGTVVRRLFTDQIPDYSKFIQGVDFTPSN